MSKLTIIGRAERIELPELRARQVPAKVDTGADSSSIWAERVTEMADGLHCVFFGKGSPYYTGEEITFPPKSYTITRVANSFGQKEVRYKLKLRIIVNQRTVRATFTLSDRSQKVYPMLLGRRLLAGKFLVDVQQGEPLLAEERRKRRQLAKDMATVTQRGHL